MGTQINRRKLLAGGLALTGARALAQDKPKAAAPGAAAGAKPAGAGSSPNMNPPVVQVKSGKLRGFRDGKTITFLGVPYADAERFEMPKAPKAWDGIKSAQGWGPICPIPQATSTGADDFVFPHRFWVENEHCQVLNVWTQSLTPAAKKPVMVWMHGGGFTNGSSMESYAYDGKTLSEFGDVVVVSMNHRVNIIGTLDVSAYGPEYAASRTTGMADLVASLQWIHDNIEVFGGDPGNVTIFGQSGGGGKVTRLMHMPSAKGLFHKVICESGSTVNYSNVDIAKVIQAQQAVAAETMKNLNLGPNDIEKLKKVPYRDLLAAGTAAGQTVQRQLGMGAGWEPVADDINVMREFCDWADEIPYMIGNVFSEFSSNMARGEYTKNEWTAKEADDKLTTMFGAKKDDIVAEFKKMYPSKKPQDLLFMDNRFRPGTKTMIDLRMKKTKTPVYNYIFAFEYPVNGGVTAFHCSEIAFAFHALTEPHIQLVTGSAPATLALQDKVSRAWVNFAKTGNPSQPGLAWKPFTKEGRETMVFDTVSAVHSYNDDKLLSLFPQGGGGRGAGRG